MGLERTPVIDEDRDPRSSAQSLPALPVERSFFPCPASSMAERTLHDRGQDRRCAAHPD